MKNIELKVESVKKIFNKKIIFQNVNFLLREKQSIAIVGKNGSGKSTLAKIVCGLLAPTGGSIQFVIDNVTILPHDAQQHLGFVAPYINLYDEFSGLENLLLFAKIRNLSIDAQKRSEELLRRFSIYQQRHDEVRTYSSGMKQRLKYCAALLHSPAILVLDEPQANLDEEGVSVVRSIMTEQKENGILIIATNDNDDLHYVESEVSIEKLKVVQ